MTKEEKKFILSELIPFILRERGRGFAMEVWRYGFSGEREFDSVVREVPSCGTVACIGGSIEILKNLSPNSYISAVGHAIGLTSAQSNRLFYGEEDPDVHWPSPYGGQWHAARTCLAKAKVAVALLKAVVASGGKVLDD